MNSSQTIHKLIYKYNSPNSYDEDMLVGLQKIKKDLKVLEIIKKRKPNIFLFTQTKNYYQYMDCEYGGYWTAGNENIMQEEEYNLIKGWLENAK